MSALVVDASTAISFLIKDERSPYALKTMALMRLTPSVFVPQHFWIEITNALVMAERRARVPYSELTVAIQSAFQLPLTTDAETGKRCQHDTLELARRFKLTIYDAAYLELALRMDSSLATVDRELAKAASKSGVHLIT